MKKAILLHIEKISTYYENGFIITPSANQKLMWEIFGLPEGVEKIDETYETVIDEFTGSKKEIVSLADKKLVNNDYNLPYTPQTELRFTI